MQVQNVLLPDTPGIKAIISVVWWSKTAFFQTLHITHKRAGYEKATGLELGMLSGYIMHGEVSVWASTQNSCTKTSSFETRSALFTRGLARLNQNIHGVQNNTRQSLGKRQSGLSTFLLSTRKKC